MHSLILYLDVWHEQANIQLPTGGGNDAASVAGSRASSSSSQLSMRSSLVRSGSLSSVRSAASSASSASRASQPPYRGSAASKPSASDKKPAPAAATVNIGADLIVAGTGKSAVVFLILRLSLCMFDRSSSVVLVSDCSRNVLVKYCDFIMRLASFRQCRIN